MKKIALLAVFSAFFVSFVFSSADEGYYSYSYARLSYTKGDVYIQRAEDLGFESGVVNLAVVAGDKLGTREGRAEIHFGKDNYLRVDSYTQVDFVELPRRGSDQIKLHLLSGNVYLRINFLVKEKNFEIHTPDASFYILEEGLYRIDVREEESELCVFEGSAEAAGEEGSLLVSSEERLIASDGDFSSDPIRFRASLDDSFSEWSRSRDALYRRSLARRYLLAELSEYEVELADNGRWVYERPYGYVWVPYVVHHDWRPYYYGRWVWYPVIGWNWVSYDPWGWCVYHYGRWHWRLGLGWYWIPTRAWGPAWVHWWRGYDHIGWCPLSYYGYPVVIVNNRFHGRYNHRYYPLHSRALTVVHKRQLQARHVSKVALSQKKMNRLGKISLSAQQPSIRPHINRSNLESKTATKVLSRSIMRKVGKVFSSGKARISASHLKPTGIRSPSRFSGTSSSEAKSRNAVKNTRKVLSPSRNLPRRSLVKTYPSRRASPSSSRLRSFSSTSSRKVSESLSPGSGRTRVSRSKASVKNYASRSSIRQSSKSSSRSRESTRTDRVNSGSSSHVRTRVLRSYKSRLSTQPKRSSSGVKPSTMRLTPSRFKKASLSKMYSSQRSATPSYRSSKNRSYATPNRSFSRTRSFSSKPASSSQSRISSFKSPSRGSTSHAKIRSSSGKRSISSRSSSVRKVKKR